MRRNTISMVIVLATFSVLGILLIQFFFLKSTADLNETRFHDAATQALKNVARHLIEYNNKTRGKTTNTDLLNEVDQISNNYYVVNVNEEINPLLLEYFLITEFKKYSLSLDFEYAIYDCERKKMIDGISLKEKNGRLQGQYPGPAKKTVAIRMKSSSRIIIVQRKRRKYPARFLPVKNILIISVFIFPTVPGITAIASMPGIL